MNMDKNVEIQGPSRKRGRNTPANVTNFKSRMSKTVPKQTCDFYEPDNSDKRTVVIEVSFLYARSALDENQVACYFGSVFCALCPDLTTSVKNALDEHGITLNVIKLPSGASTAAINLDVVDQHETAEILTLIGSCLILLFKNVSKVNYNSFISKRVRALGGKIGLMKEQIEAFKMPFGFRQAKAIRNVLGSNKMLKHEAREYLKWLSDADKDIYTSMARYVCLFCVPPKPPSMTHDEAIRFLTGDIDISDFSDDED